MTKGFLGGGGEGEALRSAAKEGNTDRIVEILERGETAVCISVHPLEVLGVAVHFSQFRDI